MAINKSEYDNYLMVLVIEDDPDRKYENMPPVNPVGQHANSMIERLSEDVLKAGLSNDMWSEKISIFMANVVIGAGEVSNPMLPLQQYFCGIASLQKKL